MQRVHVAALCFGFRCSSQPIATLLDPTPAPAPALAAVRCLAPALHAHLQADQPTEARRREDGGGTGVQDADVYGEGDGWVAGWLDGRNIQHLFSCVHRAEEQPTAH
jgi:hypothetical protein